MQEYLEQAAKEYYEANKYKSNYIHCPYSFKDGAKWQHKQDEIKYTEREVIEFADFIRNSPHVWIHRDKLNDRIPTKELLEIFKMK